MAINIPFFQGIVSSHKGPSSDMSSGTPKVSFAEELHKDTASSNPLNYVHHALQKGGKVEESIMESTTNKEQDIELVNRITNLEMEVRKVTSITKKALEAWKQIQQTGM